MESKIMTNIDVLYETSVLLEHFSYQEIDTIIQSSKVRFDGIETYGKLMRMLANRLQNVSKDYERFQVENEQLKKDLESCVSALYDR